MSRALAVLERLRSEPRGLTLSQLSRELGTSHSTLLAVLRTLCRRGYLVRTDAGRYRIGPAAADLGGGELAAHALWRAAEAVLGLVSAAGAPRREVLQGLGQAAAHLAAVLLGGSERPSESGAAVWERSGPLSPAELEEFLQGGWVATLSCIKDNGYPYSVPVWYQWREGRFWVVSRGAAEWVRYLELDPRVSLAISEHTPPLRRVLVEGQAEQVEGQAHELLAAMAVRYLGPGAGSYLNAASSQLRRAFSIRPERMVSWRGLSSHPRYQAVRQRPLDEHGVA